MAAILEIIFSGDIKKLKKTLKKEGANCKIPGTDGCTPLHIVAGLESNKEKEEMISMLLEIGADPNARSFENLTPVHIAAMWDNCNELEMLLKNGGNPWITDNERKNSFDMAADNNAYEAFQLLNKYQAEDKLNYPVRNNCTQCVSSNIFLDEMKDSKINSKTAFLTANEYFLSALSSGEDNGNVVLNLSKCLKKKRSSEFQRQSQNTSSSESSDSSISKLRENFNRSMKILDQRKHNKTNLNHAHFCSTTESETEEFGFLDSTLNNCSEVLIDSDNESGIALIEKFLPISDTEYTTDDSTSSIGSDWKSCQNSANDYSISSVCSTHSQVSVVVPNEMLKYSNSQIFQELKKLGDDPGPILDYTRHVYLLRLARLKAGCKTTCILPKPKYCSEIYLFLDNEIDMTRARIMEQNMAIEFESNVGKPWREGNQRCCFNYFLLDPRVTQNLPLRAPNLTFKQIFLIFLDSLFYVGKGTKGRPYQHLFEAAKSMTSNAKRSQKVSHILSIWEAGLGVISLHCFNNSIPVEAYTREACIIEAVGLSNLTNIKKGDFYGCTARLKASHKRLVGISLLQRVCQIFLLEGERQIKPKDIQAK